VIVQPQLWLHCTFGRFEEPFFTAMLNSVVPHVDGVAVVNNDPEGVGYGQKNEQILRRHVPREKLKLQRVTVSERGMDFGKIRTLVNEAIPLGAYGLIADCDDVPYPDLIPECRQIIADGYDIATFHFFHLAVFKNLLHSERHREILYRNSEGVHFENAVHELLVHPRERPILGKARYVHYGYVRSARAVARKWEFYRSLGAEIHDYDVSQPDRALDDWPRVCTPFWREHPPAVRELLESYPSVPKPEREPRNPRVGLVMLTWNDAENLKDCLASLATTEEPFDLTVIDNGSDDETDSMLREARKISDGPNPLGPMVIRTRPGLSLAAALNEGFGWYLDPNGEHERITPGRTKDYADIEYLGWIHPDMTFDWPDWLGQLVKGLDEHPEWAKLGAWEVDSGRQDAPWPGNSQCFLVRRAALEQIGPFDEVYRGVGGYEDWDANRRLLDLGRVMITPEAKIRHEGMGTRKRLDSVADAIANAEYYCEKWGTNEAPV
jgi:GT2 family glycosyltransferase